MSAHKATAEKVEAGRIGRTRVRFVVEVDLDPVLGWGHEPDDWEAMLRHYLTQTVGHYRPTVEYDGETDGVIPPVSTDGVDRG